MTGSHSLSARGLRPVPFWPLAVHDLPCHLHAGVREHGRKLKGSAGAEHVRLYLRFCRAQKNANGSSIPVKQYGSNFLESIAVRAGDLPEPGPEDVDYLKPLLGKAHQQVSVPHPVNAGRWGRYPTVPDLGGSYWQGNTAGDVPEYHPNGCDNATGEDSSGF